MKAVAVLLLIFLPAVLRPALAQQPDPEEIEIVAEGVAPLSQDPVATEEEAIWDAKRNAVEQAVGVLVRSRTVGRDFAVEEEEIQGRSEGFLRRWQSVPDSRRIETVAAGENGRVLHIKIRATVALMPLLRRLSDMADVYADLERPRVRVTVEGDPARAPEAGCARNALVAALQAQGFEVASDGPAEIVFAGRLAIVPTVHLGDAAAPYGIGQTVAACRARLEMQVVSEADEEVLLTARAEADGQSFQSDAEADAAAAANVSSALLQENEAAFVQRLLVRWAHERQDGHLVAVTVTGLDTRRREALREALRDMRGFCNLRAETGDGRTTSFRFLTRLDTRSVRRRLAALRLADQPPLHILNDRGPLILCAADTRPALSAGRSGHVNHRARHVLKRSCNQ